MDATESWFEEPSGIEPRGEGSPMGLSAVNADHAGAAAEAVTLVVYGWTAAEPGTLWWAFPSVGAALAAAHAMKNAVLWAIVEGPPRGAIVDISTARAAGSVLVEQAHAS